jgi:CHRD domain-containing protein
MKRYVWLGLALFAAACGSSTSPSSTQPTTVVFTAALSAANETPAPITNADKDARGSSTMTFHLTRDSSGTITAATVDFVYSLSGFPPGTPIILTHIHEGGPGIGGGVKIGAPLSPATAITLADGTATNITFSNISGWGDGIPLVQRIIDNPNGFYFNVHSQLNPGGAVRGQLVRQ